MQAYILLSLQDASEEKILEKINNNPEVVDAKLVFGEWDLIVKIESETTEGLGKFVMSKLRNLEGVKMTSTLICAA